MTVRRVLKIALITVASIVGLVLLTLLSAYMMLKTPSVTARIMPKLKSALKANGVDMDIGSLSIDLIRHVEIENVSGHMAQPPLTLDFAAKRLNLHYSLWDLIVHRELTVDEVLADGIVLDVKMIGPPAPPAPPTPAPTGPPAQPDRLIAKPPAGFALKRLVLDNASVAVLVDAPGQKVSARINPLHFETSVSLAPGRLELDFSTKIQSAGAPITVIQETTAPVSKTELAFELGVDVAGKLKLETNLIDYRFDLPTLKAETELRNVVLHRTDAAQDVTVRLAKTNFRAIIAANSSETGAGDSFVDKFLFPLSFKVDVATNLDHLTVQQQSAATGSVQLDLPQFTFALTTEGELKGRTDPFLTLTNITKGKVGLEKLKVILNPKGKPQQTVDLAQEDLQFSTNLKAKKFDFEASIDSKGIALAPKITHPFDVAVTIKTNHDDILENIARRGWVSSDLTLVLNDFVMPGLAGPVAAKAGFTVNAVLKDRDYNLKGKVGVNGSELTELEIGVKDKAKQLIVDATIGSRVSPELAKVVAALKSLAMVGGIGIKNKLTVTLKHPFATLEDFKSEQVKQMSADVTLVTDISQFDKATDKKTRLILAKPATITNHVVWSPKKIVHTLDAKIPTVGVDKQVKVDDITLHTEASAESGMDPKNADVSVELHRGPMRLYTIPHRAQIEPLLTPLAVKMTAGMRGRKTAHLKSLVVTLGNHDFVIDTKGLAALDLSHAQSSGSLSINANRLKGFEKGLTASGLVGLIWDLTLMDKDRVALDGTLKIDDFNVANEMFALKGANGTFPLHEEIRRLPHNQAKFAYLVDQDPFQRVDYRRVQPYLDGEHSFGFEQLRFKDYVLGPLNMSFAIEQNMLHAPFFELDLFGGSLSGEFFLNFHPEQLKLGMKGILTHFDPTQLITSGKALQDKGKHKGYISGSSAVVFDLNRSLIEGQVNITEISGNQLIILLNVIDPNYEDPRLAPLRSALNFGYPENVEMKMKYGLMDLKVIMHAVANSTIEVKGIELSRFVTAYTEPLKKALKGLPLR